jgi:hypothetical protein
VTALAHQLAGLIGPFHGKLLRCRGSARLSPENQRRKRLGLLETDTSGAADAKGPGAYTGGPDAKSMRRRAGCYKAKFIEFRLLLPRSRCRETPFRQRHMTVRSPSCNGGLVYSSCDVLRGRAGPEAPRHRKPFRYDAG